MSEPQKHLKRREVATMDPSEATFGPRMLALNERQQKFVVALFTTVKPGHGAAARAARAAGFGTPGSSPSSIATIASRLMHEEKLLDAMREFGEQFLKGSAPAALRALQKLILTPGHKGHERAVAAVVDRLYPVEPGHPRHSRRYACDENYRRGARAHRPGVDVAKMPPLVEAKPVSTSEKAA